jgi:3-oxoacyl-[acyl-carrier protein] reductase
LVRTKRCFLKRLDQRVAIITGAAGGLGRATAAQFVREGAALGLIDIGDCQNLIQELKSIDPQARVIALQVDVTDEEAISKAINEVITAFQKIDILVNIAGVVSHGNSSDVTLAEWQRVLNINLTSTFICSKAVLPNMRANGYGRVISMSSILGKNGGNPRPWINPEEQKKAGNVAYGVSKAGINALTFYLAKENAHHGITVNAIAPGPVASNMTTNFPQTLKDLIPVGRMGKAEDIAEAVTFLAAESAGFITGEVLDVNGGAWMD